MRFQRPLYAFFKRFGIQQPRMLGEMEDRVFPVTEVIPDIWTPNNTSMWRAGEKTPTESAIFQRHHLVIASSQALGDTIESVGGLDGGIYNVFSMVAISNSTGASEVFSQWLIRVTQSDGTYDTNDEWVCRMLYQAAGCHFPTLCKVPHKGNINLIADSAHAVPNSRRQSCLWGYKVAEA